MLVRPSTPLGDVTVNSSGSIGLGGNVTQGASKDLILRRGNIPIGDHAWMIKNPVIEHDLAVRTAVPTKVEGTDGSVFFPKVMPGARSLPERVARQAAQIGLVH